MFYTVITLLVWLLLGAPRLSADFSPVLIAFIIAIVVDLYTNRGLLVKG